MELKYTKTHEWVKDSGDGVFVVGITDHAQELLGDMVYVELPEVGTKIHLDSESGVVESVKAASDLYSPLTGTIIEVNDAVVKNPGIVNQDPYGEGWLFKVRSEHTEELAKLMEASAYEAQVAAEA